MIVKISSGPARWADVFEHAGVAAWLSGVADPSAVQDEPQAERSPLLRSEEAAELVLDLHRVVVLREPEPPAQAADVGVDRQAG